MYCESANTNLFRLVSMLFHQCKNNEPVLSGLNEIIINKSWYPRLFTPLFPSTEVFCFMQCHQPKEAAVVFSLLLTFIKFNLSFMRPINLDFLRYFRETLSSRSGKFYFDVKCADLDSQDKKGLEFFFKRAAFLQHGDVLINMHDEETPLQCSRPQTLFSPHPQPVCL